MIRARVVTRLALAMALVATASPRASRAQARSMTGNVVATVDVVYPPLTGVGIRPLDFGMIIPGTPSVTVMPNTINGAEYRIVGTSSRKSVDITFVLPASLTSASGGTIPLNFNGNYAGLCEVDDATQLCVAASFFAWNPVVTPTYHDTPTRYKSGRPRYTYNTYSVYIGGQATPPANAPPGHYTGTVDLTIVIN